MTPRERLDLRDPFRVDVLVHLQKGLLAQGVFVSFRELNRHVSRPKREFGDYSFHCHKAATALGIPPEAVAQGLRESYDQRRAEGN